MVTRCRAGGSKWVQLREPGDLNACLKRAVVVDGTGSAQVRLIRPGSPPARVRLMVYE